MRKNKAILVSDINDFTTFFIMSPSYCVTVGVRVDEFIVRLSNTNPAN